MDTFGQQFYAEQLDYLARKDVDGLIDHHYNDDALLVGFDWTVRGRDALKTHFRGYLQMLGFIEVVSTDKFKDTGDTLFLEATVKTALGTAKVYDALVLRDGKIAYHFTGVK